MKIIEDRLNHLLKSFNESVSSERGINPAFILAHIVLYKEMLSSAFKVILSKAENNTLEYPYSGICKNLENELDIQFDCERGPNFYDSAYICCFMIHATNSALRTEFLYPIDDMHELYAKSEDKIRDWDYRIAVIKKIIEALDGL